MSDKRKDGPNFPVADAAFAQGVWADTETGALQKTLSNINGEIGAIDIVISDATNAITFTVAITNANGATIYSEAGLAENASHFKVAYSNKGTQDADFNPALVNGDLTATLTPSGDPGASGVTVDVTVYYK
jgi:hypothetical protein